MKAYLIEPQTQTVSVQDFDGQPHSLYTLFGSLLVDTHEVLKRHNVYSAAEAFEKGEKGFFLGEKLLFGKTLVTGREGFEDIDAAILPEELETLVMYDLPAFYEKVLALLPKDFSFSERYMLQAGDMQEAVNPEWVFYVFNMADEATKNYFLNHLEETVVRKNDIHAYLKKMGEIAVKSMGQ